MLSSFYKETVGLILKYSINQMKGCSMHQMKGYTPSQLCNFNMSYDNISQNQPKPSRDLSEFYVLNHFSSNYHEASCYSLHLFNPPNR